MSRCQLFTYCLALLTLLTNETIESANKHNINKDEIVFTPVDDGLGSTQQQREQQQQEQEQEEGEMMSSETQNPKHWNSYKKSFHKRYKDQILEKSRRKIWESKFRQTTEHNEKAKHSKEISFTLGLNKYSDMVGHYKEIPAKMKCVCDDKTDDEIRKSLLGLRVTATELMGSESTKATHRRNTRDVTSQAVDWRTRGAVSDVSDQDFCGSCYAFSSTGALEGQRVLKLNKSLESLSQQQVVDCSQKYGNYGCDGGLMTNVFTYVKENNGIATELSYPYKAEMSVCLYNTSTMSVAATCSGFVQVSPGTESALLRAVETVGPVSVGINAALSSFISYASGVYNDADCNSTDLNHAVLVVGYGSEQGLDYWIVKNSWGSSWGEEGYVRMARNKNNQCGIARLASYPLV